MRLFCNISQEGILIPRTQCFHYYALTLSSLIRMVNNSLSRFATRPFFRKLPFIQSIE